MSKECKKARNIVMSAITILAMLIIVMSMSSCGGTKEMKPCCKKTAQAVYEYEGWTIDHAN